MAKRYTDEFRRDAVRIATTSGVLQCHLPTSGLACPLRSFGPVSFAIMNPATS